jgi:hypothetical protein
VPLDQLAQVAQARDDVVRQFFGCGEPRRARHFGHAAGFDDGGKLGKVAFLERRNSSVCCASKK